MSREEMKSMMRSTSEEHAEGKQKGESKPKESKGTLRFNLLKNHKDRDDNNDTGKPYAYSTVPCLLSTCIDKKRTKTINTLYIFTIFSLYSPPP